MRERSRYNHNTTYYHLQNTFKPRLIKQQKLWGLIRRSFMFMDAEMLSIEERYPIN